MISLSKFVYSLDFKKRKKVIKVLSLKYCNKKIVAIFLNDFYKLYSYIFINSLIKKNKFFFFFIQFNFFFKKKKNINLYFKYLKKNKRILYYNSTFIKLIETFFSEINPILWKYPYDDDSSEILYHSGSFSSNSKDFLLQNVRNITYERIYLKGWFI